MALEADEASVPETIDCDLCVVGAGITGLNAIFAASHYLDASARVVLVDQKLEAGGMWPETYDYARLHQPYPMFTVGNFGWSLKKPAWHLASKQEVVGHLKGCLTRLRERFTLIERFGYRCEGHEEVAGAHGWHAVIECIGVSGGQRLSVRAKRCIKAVGADIKSKPPLELTSHRVASVSPHGGATDGPPVPEGEQPIYVIGGGKTAMDTAHRLVKDHPERPVHMVIGQGCVFWNRDRIAPTGLRRWLGGFLPLNCLLDVARRYRGDNADEVFEYFKAQYCLALNGNARQFRWGILSEAELSTIRNGVDEVIEDYLEDVVDEEGQPVMVFRSGDRRPVEAGSCVINGTSYIDRSAEEAGYEPYLSPNGTVVSINARSSVTWLTTYAGYFLTHLFYQNRLADLPLYRINFIELERTDKTALSVISMTHMIHNLLLILPSVPAKAAREWGLDHNRWYPLVRRIWAVVKLMITGRRDWEHTRKALDRASATLGIECGRLPNEQGS
jgi:hypothetical protein